MLVSMMLIVVFAATGAKRRSVVYPIQTNAFFGLHIHRNRTNEKPPRNTQPPGFSRQIAANIMPAAHNNACAAVRVSRIAVEVPDAKLDRQSRRTPDPSHLTIGHCS